MNGYASHLPVLEAILDKWPACKHVVEFGSGEFSTDFFLKRGLHLVSIESDPAWAEKMKGLHAKAIEEKQLDLISLDPGYTELHIIGDLFQRHCDLLIIDGSPAHYRGPILQAAILMDAAKVIVCHDSQEDAYGYQHVVLPGASKMMEPWMAMDIRDERPWTMAVSRHCAALRDMSAGFKQLAVYVEDALKTKEFLS